MIYFLIPVYNEEKNLERLYRDTSVYMDKIGRKDDFTFIFVDDGSTDQSPSILQEFAETDGRSIVLTHFPNAGVRKTFMDGFREFLRVAGSGDILVTKEADNTSDNHVLQKMLTAVEQEDYDIALASCYAEGGGLESTTLFRMLLSTCANMLIKFRFGLWGLHTFSSFYRAFRFTTLESAFKNDSEIMSYEGFTCVVEMLIKMKKMKFRIKEIPMILRSSERIGKSKMPVKKTIIEYIFLCIKGTG